MECQWPLCRAPAKLSFNPYLRGSRFLKINLSTKKGRMKKKENYEGAYWMKIICHCLLRLLHQPADPVSHRISSFFLLFASLKERGSHSPNSYICNILSMCLPFRIFFLSFVVFNWCIEMVCIWCRGHAAFLRRWIFYRSESFPWRTFQHYKFVE